MTYLNVKTKQTEIVPLLQFQNQCEEAIRLYQEAFDAELLAFMRFSEADPKDFSDFSEGEKNLIYHAQLKIGNQRIIMCDNLFNKLPVGNSIYLCLMLPSADDVKKVFDILSKDGMIYTAPAPTTYSECLASFTDKFGMYWDLMVD